LLTRLYTEGSYVTKGQPMIIDAQIQMYPAERSAIIYDLERKEALVNLYRALGGGWNLNDSQWISTSGASAPAQSPTP
jgi:hypothetical protein